MTGEERDLIEHQQAMCTRFNNSPEVLKQSIEEDLKKLRLILFAKAIVCTLSLEYIPSRNFGGRTSQRGSNYAEWRRAW